LVFYYIIHLKDKHQKKWQNDFLYTFFHMQKKDEDIT